jgi:hypothetical protein
MESLLKLVKENLSLFIEHPWQMLLIIAASCGAAYWVCDWHYKERIATLETRNSDLSNRLSDKAAAGNPLLKISDTDLQSQALSLAKEIRDFATELDMTLSRIDADARRVTTSSAPEDEKTKKWNQSNTDTRNAINLATSKFDTKYKTNAMNLVDEIVRRYPERQKFEEHTGYFHHPGSSQDFRSIADTLEQKAKTLQ